MSIGRVVSIHTPIQGVTIRIIEKYKGEKFQSTHPYRVWLSAGCLPGCRKRFQSTHPYRVWHLNLSDGTSNFLFQSTHPYRVWRLSMMQVPSEPSFNPHTHTGCDYDSGNIKGDTGKFQSTHPYRVWQSFGKLCFCLCDVSIHTPIQGVTGWRW